MKKLKVPKIKYVDAVRKIEKHIRPNCHITWFFVCLLVVALLWAFLLWDGGSVFNKPAKPQEAIGIWLGRAKITAYSEIDSCHYENCIMASGERADVGYIACPRAIPIGTKIYISGLIPNYFECGDRTAKYYKGKLIDGRYDIFVGYGKEAYQKALKFGIQEHDVYIIKLIK